MNRKLKFTLLITFVLFCLIAVNVFATTTYVNPNQTQSVQQYVEQPIQNNQQTNNVQYTQAPVNTNVQEKQIVGDEALPEKQKTELLKLKDQSRDSLTKYKEKYKNNVVYGTIAYVLNIVRLASVPFFVIGYLISIVYEFIVGMKRREMVRKGRGMRITLGSAFIMAQVLPLVFAIVIKFWGN